LPLLDVRNLSCSYGRDQVLKDVSLSADRGEVIGLVGPSGSGKSTFLRALIGLTRPDGGAVTVDGDSVDYGSRKSLRELRSRLAIVFQQYNLFQNMTVLGNVTVAPIKIQKRPRKEVEALASDLLTRVGMEEKLNAYPEDLSGGQQQRVAIARALALEPEILLLDEVTSALDPERVGEVLDTIRRLTGEGITMLLVSHEMAFVREVATRVVMMDGGYVVESGPPTQVFDAPQEQRTRDFMSKIIKH